MMCVSIQQRHKWQPSPLKQSMCASYRLFLYGLCKDEREKLAEKQQKACHQVTSAHNDLLKPPLTRSCEEAGESVLTSALLSCWQLAPRCWWPPPSPKGARCPALPLPPCTTPCAFLGGGTHHCLVSLLLVNSLVWFAKKHKVLFEDAAFGFLTSRTTAVYRGSS